MANKSNSPLAELVAQFAEQEADIRLGGGQAAIERQHKKNRLTARQRIEKLLDPSSSFFELGLWNAWQMYTDWGGAPAAGVVTGIGMIAGRRHMIIANDATVKAGAFFPATAKKVLRAQRIAMQNRLPLVYLVDSSGIFLPLQEDVFPDEDDFGRIFRNNAVISAMGLGQIAAIMGNCVAGGGYLPVLCDKLLMTEGSGLYLAGPALVKSAIGQEVSHEELGGAAMHAEVSGTIDYRDPTDDACLERLRQLASAVRPDDPLPPSPFQRAVAKPPQRPATDLYHILSSNPTGEYEVRDVLSCLLDANSFEEYKPDYGQTLVCGTARLGGFSIGIVANQHHRVRPADGPFQFGGVLYVDSAEKAARFVMNCNQDWLPIVFLQDVNGFMVGRDAERSGIIKAGAKLVSAISNSRVPKITVITGGSYGAGNYALCGKAFDPRFIFAWPSAQIAVMGGEQASDTLLDVAVKSLQRQGDKIDDAELEKLRDQVKGDYERQMDVRYAAARGWVDAILDPATTRDSLIVALQCATRHAELEPFRLGVFQVEAAMTIRIANAAGFLGDDLDAPRLLVENARVDYLTLEYLAELTMSILARRREKDPSAGYADDFLDVLKSLLPALKSQSNLKIVTNAGGVNPRACAAAAATILNGVGLGETIIGVVTGDDLLPRLSELKSAGCRFENLDTGQSLAELRQPVASANAYLGAQPIAEALAGGARIVITGRVADASLTVGPAAHEFGWKWNDWNRLAGGSVAGHLIECGAQVTGGLYRHWQKLDLANVGYPIAELNDDGSCVITKPMGSGGAVNRNTVIEQLVYEIGDPAHYLTPDVDVDFTTLEVTKIGPDRVAVNRATGLSAPESYKVSLAYSVGFTASGMLLVNGNDCVEKARACGSMILKRVARAGYELQNTLIECLGAGDGVPSLLPIPHSTFPICRELVLRVSASDSRREALERFTKEFAPLITSGPPGLAGYATGRPQVRPVFAYWPTLVPKQFVQAATTIQPARKWSEVSK